MSVITTSSLNSFMSKEIQPAIEVKVKAPALYQRIYDTVNSGQTEMATRRTGVTPFGMPEVYQENSPVPQATFRELNKDITIKEHYSLEVRMTIFAMYYNQHQEIKTFINNDLPEAFRQRRELKAMQPFNNAFNPAVTYPMDGVPLCSLVHPTAGAGLQANMPSVSIGVSEVAFEQMLTWMDTFVDQAGKVSQRTLKSMLFHPAQQFEVQRILGSTLQNDTAQNAINAIKSMGKINLSQCVFNPWLATTTNWFAIMDAPSVGFEFRPGMGFKAHAPNSTDSVTVKQVYTDSYAFASAYDPRAAVYGSAGI